MNRKQRRAEGKASKAVQVQPMGGRIEDQIFQNALFHHQSGRLVEAETGYRAALARNPRHTDALSHLGMLAHQSGQSDDGIDLLKKAIASDKRNPDLHYNLACLFVESGRDEEAIAHLRKAIELKPDYVAAHSNLSGLLLLLGRHDEALVSIVRGLKVEETKSLKSNFAMLVQASDPAKIEISDDLLHYLTRAIAEPWSRPRDLSGFATLLLTRDPLFVRAISRMSGSPLVQTSDILNADELASVSGNHLLNAVLSTSPVTAFSIERLLTVLRRTLLNDVNASDATTDQRVTLASLIAEQCFINGYVFDDTEQEAQKVAAILDDVAESLKRDVPVMPIKIALLAAYMPLHSIGESQKITSRDWPEPVRTLITQQILNPERELDIRATIENLTPVKDSVSEKVRAQYEESPYPQWSRIVSDNQPIAIDQYIATRFPGVPYKKIGGGPVNLLVAGCGTGMHAIQRAQLFAQSNVLAIDLSLSSLSYAIRRTTELGIKNIRYAQADILEFTSDKAFDVIDSSGVLHHLKYPLEGWRRLAMMLRSGGLMHIGLYSSIARRTINVAREVFAKQGRQFSTVDTRRLRTEIFNMTEDDELRKVGHFSDFYSMSEFRDLLFHVQEHQFSIPQIAGFLSEIGFAFIGFETQARQAYLKRFPDDAAAINLGNWHAFETENPATFAHMYQFWIQKN